MKIRELRLKSDDLTAQANFYSDVLKLRTRVSKKWIEIEVGNANLVFEFCYQSTPYHFAFNIPSNQIINAHEWLKKRVKLLPYNGIEIVQFDDWNAEAVYFYDPDKNIVEFIARKNLDKNIDGPFHPSQILGISEIGLAVGDIKKAYNEINNLGDSPVYDGNFERFCAAGDEEGLFIIINHTKKKWAPVDDDAHESPFKLRGSLNMKFEQGKIQML